MNTSERANYFYTSANTFLTGYTESTHAFTQYVGLLSTSITGGSATINSSQLYINIPNNAGNLVFNDSNGVSFGVSSNGSTTTVTASVNAGGGGVAISVANSVWTSGTLALSASSNITITTAAGNAVFSVADAIPLANSTQYATSILSASLMPLSYSSGFQTATLANTFLPIANTTNFAGVGETTAGAISMTVNTAGVSASVPAVGYLSLVNSAGYTWSTSVNGVSTAIWIVLA
jgi:hypothetical protein